MQCGRNRTTEKSVAITHPGGEVTVYLHLSKILVTLNQSVAGGQIVAESGNSSNGDGGVDCHLHFHVWGGFGSLDSHTQPIEHLILKRVGVDQTFREYNSNNGDLDDSLVAGQMFEADIDCHLYSVGSTVPDGFGVPWDVFDPKTLLLKAFCTNSSEIADIGPATYVYNQGYAWDGTQWNQVTFTCTGGALVSNAWCPNTAQGSLPSNTKYYVGYTCQWLAQNNKWYCGCRDKTCAQNLWQLQQIQR
jgi:hypothetical protein